MPGELDRIAGTVLDDTVFRPAKVWGKRVAPVTRRMASRNSMSWRVLYSGVAHVQQAHAQRLPKWRIGFIVVTEYLLQSAFQRFFAYPMNAPTTDRIARRQRLSTDERQREIVAAVLSLVRERGPDAITTQAIADRIGVTQGAIFRHFPDKEAIWLAVFAWVRKSLVTALATALVKCRSPLEKIEAAFLAHVAFIAANPGVPRVMFHELQYPGHSPVRAEVRKMISGYRQRLASLFAEARTAGELSGNLDTELAAALFIGAVQSLVIESALAGDESGMVQRAQRMFPLLLDGYRGPSKL